MFTATILALSLVVTPVTAPTPEQTPTEKATLIKSVALYIYQKLDSTLPAAWENSGKQDLISTQLGVAYFTKFPGELPDYVCGEGWAIQQDKGEHDEFFVWPETIEYPHDNIGWPPIYDAKHQELSELIDVPECVEAEPPVDEPQLPTLPLPEEPKTLADTGPEDVKVLLTWGLGLSSLGLLVYLLGLWARRRFAR